mgnify:CR=1 FL=1
MSRHVSEHQLNAFVDGELSPPEAAQIASVIATSPMIAQRVARLHQTKAAIAAMADDLVLPDVTQPQPRSLWRVAVGLAGVAAMLMLLFWSAPAPEPAPVSDAASLPLMAQHDHWAGQETGSASLDLPDGFAWLGSVMQSSGLQLVYLAQGAGMQHFGFKGQNACRISLFMTTSTHHDSPLQLTLSERVQHAHWQIDGFAFEMIARDMASARFAAVATSLHRESHDHAPDAALRIALLQAARLPCTA